MKPTDEELVIEYKKGNENAFNEIYSRYKNLVKFYSRNLFLLGADNDDLMQEGMLGLIKAVNGYREGESSFLTYASTCIKTSLITAVKKYANKKSSPLNNSASFEILDKIGLLNPTPEDVVLLAEDDKELKLKIYSELSKTEILVLNLYLYGYSYDEIAKSLNKNVKSIDNALSRARKKIISRLGE